MNMTEQQKENRLKFITGSDAAVICGVSPWGNVIDLWRQKCRLAEQEDISHLPHVKAGIFLENAVVEWFEHETQKVCETELEFQIHKSIPWMGGTIDRRVRGENAILECKTTSHDGTWGNIGDNIIPDYYLCQCAHYAAVCDVERVFVAVLIRGVDFRWYTYERNQKLEDIIISKEKAFWENVKSETPPEPRTKEEIISLYNVATDSEPLIADESIENALYEVTNIKKQIKALEEQQTNNENFIKAFMKNHDILHGKDGKIVATWKNAKGATRFDAKKFAEEHEELYGKYLKTSESTRRFLLK